MDNILGWFATVATITAASLTASNLGPKITGYGFVIFAVGSVAWIGVGLSDNQMALVWTNVVLTGLNLFGIWRWLGRAAKFEKGSRVAAARSGATPGEALFPVTLLTRAKVQSGDVELGQCVDAMAGTDSGTIAYVMVSDGGVAGAGETLRRLDWHDLRVKEGEVVCQLGEAQFRALEPIERDRWPAK